MGQRQKINVQYSNKEWIRKLFRCKFCGADTILIGCPNPDCKDYYKKNKNYEKSKNN